MRAKTKGNGDAEAKKADTAAPKGQMKGMIVIPPIDVQEMYVHIVSLNRLVTHAYAQKVQQAQEDKRHGVAVQPKVMTPEEEFELSQHKDENGHFFPSSGVKKCAVTAGSSLKAVISKTLIRQAVHVKEDRVRILGDGPHHRKDAVRVRQSGVIRSRAEFRTWRARFTIMYNAGIISPAQVFNLYSTAGFAVGLGENRPGKSDGGSWGTFRLATRKEIETLKWA